MQVIVDIPKLELFIEMKEMFLPRSSSLKSGWDEEEEEDLKYRKLVGIAQRISGEKIQVKICLYFASKKSSS